MNNKLPEITDRDEWVYLDSLKPSHTIGIPKSVDQGYYARVLQRKYTDCSARVTATTFQILKLGFSSDNMQFTQEQHARQQLFARASMSISKERWLKLLKENGLLPSRS